MKSKTHGSAVASVKVTDISPEGVAIVIDGRAFFMPYDGFPWFRNASAAAVRNVHRLGPRHLHWPDLDVDLEPESIEFPERFPLIFDPCRSARTR